LNSRTEKKEGSYATKPDCSQSDGNVPSGIDLCFWRKRRQSQLMTNVFNNMKTLSDRFLEDNRTRTYIPPDALNNDPLDQRILNCAQSLAAMAASGQFIYDASCH
jgi:hypothetical protein